MSLIEEGFHGKELYVDKHRKYGSSTKFFPDKALLRWHYTRCICARFGVYTDYDINPILYCWED